MISKSFAALLVTVFVMAAFHDSRVSAEENIGRDFATVVWSPSEDDICSITSVKAALINDQILFFGDGLRGKNGTPLLSQQLYLIPLEDARPVSELLQSDVLRSGNVSNAMHPDLENPGNGPFWYDSNSLYTLSQSSTRDQGGTESSRELWSLEVSENALASPWEQLSNVERSWSQSNLEGAPYASAPDLGLSFVADLVGSDRSKLMLNTTNDRPEWKVLDTLGAVDSPRTGASMFFAPFGHMGVLFFLGGDSSMDNDTTYMEEVGIFDLASSRWYYVKTLPNKSTTGTAKGSEYPERRGAFCGWPADDGSSYSIVIYGGENQAISKVYGDVWALSIPSFQWIKLDPGESFDAHSHVCMKHRENYGFVLGGHGPTNEDEMSCSGLPAVRLLDLSLLQWVTEFTPGDAVEYRVNEKIAIKDTNPDLPNDLRNILNTRISQTDPKTSSGDNTSPSTTATPSSNSTSTNLLSIGAKVGIGLGISIFILLLALGALFFLKRRRRHQSAQPPISKRLPTDDFQAEDLVTKNAAHVEMRYRGSVSPPGVHADSHVQTQTHGSVTTTSGPYEQQGQAHGLPPREEVHSSTSHYSNDVLNYHHGGEQQQHEHAPNDERERRPSLGSVVSSLAETTVPAQAEETNSDARAGVSPILSPVSPVRTSHEEEFRLDEQPSSTTK